MTVLVCVLCLVFLLFYSFCIQRFSEAVRRRDNNKCVVSGNPTVCAAHILPHSERQDYPNIDVFDVRNGICLTETLETNFDDKLWYVDTVADTNNGYRYTFCALDPCLIEYNGKELEFGPDVSLHPFKELLNYHKAKCLLKRELTNNMLRHGGGSGGGGGGGRRGSKRSGDGGGRGGGGGKGGGGGREGGGDRGRRSGGRRGSGKGGRKQGQGETAALERDGLTDFKKLQLDFSYPTPDRVAFLFDRFFVPPPTSSFTNVRIDETPSPPVPPSVLLQAGNITPQPE